MATLSPAVMHLHQGNPGPMRLIRDLLPLDNHVHEGYEINGSEVQMYGSRSLRREKSYMTYRVRTVDGRRQALPPAFVDLFINQRHVVNPAPRGRAASTALDEIVPGIPMARWKRGKYDRKAAKAHRKALRLKDIAMRDCATSVFSATAMIAVEHIGSH